MLLTIVTALAGCATPSLTVRGSAGPGSLDCVASLLRDAGYELTEGPGFVVGETRIMAGETGVTREFIEAQAPGDRTLEIRATAVRIEGATHGLPIQRQTASPVEPSPEASSLASTILARCSS